MPAPNRFEIDHISPFIAWEVSPVSTDSYSDQTLRCMGELSVAALTAAAVGVMEAHGFEVLRQQGSTVPDALLDRYTLLEGRQVHAIRAQPGAQRNPADPLPVRDMRYGLYTAWETFTIKMHETAQQMDLTPTDIAPYIADLLIPPIEWYEKGRVWVPEDLMPGFSGSLYES